MKLTIEEIEKIKQQIEIEKSQSSEMGSQISQIQMTILNEKKKLGGVN